MTADFKGLHYLTGPNQVQRDQGNKAPRIENGGDMFEMNPHGHRCCQHNVGHGWPYFAEHLWMATADDGLAAVLYCADQVKAKVGDGAEVLLTETDPLPVRRSIAITVQTPRCRLRFPLYLRVPGWCDRPAVNLNGKPSPSAAKAPAGWLVIDRYLVGQGPSC